MRYKNIAKVGATLISILFVLAGLMFYFSQEKCPSSTFPCDNGTKCVPQSSWCDGIADCDTNEDEHEDMCFDFTGSWEFFVKERATNTNVTCDRSPCLAGCNCGVTNCELRCINAGFARIPNNFSSNATTIVLQSNPIRSISGDDLRSYRGLKSLYIQNNEISRIEIGAFKSQEQLVWLMLSNNKLRELRKGSFEGLKSLEWLLADNNRIAYADFSDFENESVLEQIDLNRNSLCSECLKFPYLPGLKDLFLDRNNIEEISRHLFAGLPDLRGLSLEHNAIRSIHVDAFLSTTRLLELSLAHNEIICLPENIFRSMKNLVKLRLGFNPIDNLTATTFVPLQQLRSLDLQGIKINGMEKSTFEILPNLYFAYFKEFHYCPTYAPHAQVCRPRTDGVSSLTHLLGKPALRVAVWGISCVTCLGNALVLWGRFTARDENRVLGIMIRNLAVSDLLMGVYLFVIAVEDIKSRGNYNVMANDWMTSWSCTFTGALAMISSEVSVLILAFMSVERFVLIAAPLKSHRAMTSQMAYSSMIVIWVIGIILALVPVIHWRSSTRFYGANGMCFPLHIDNPYLVGWEYSAFVFLGVNLLGLVVIGYVYTGMFASIWRTRHATPLAVRDSEFALRFFLIVFTDTVCWAPIIILKIIAMTMYPVPPDLHAWVVIFILPVNSAVNPLLYTFTTAKFRERLGEGWFALFRDLINRRQSDTQMSRTSSNKNMVIASIRKGKEQSQESGIEKLAIAGEDEI